MKIAGTQPLARRAEPKERSPKVAIFDYFNDEEGVRHGDRVESILLRSGGLDDSQVQNYLNTYERDDFDEVVNAPTEELMGRVQAYTEQTVAGFLQATTTNLNMVMTEDKGIRVINQSQSQSPGRIAKPFVEKILTDEKFRMGVKDALGLNRRAFRSTVAEEFLAKMNETFSSSEPIQLATEAYRETAQRAYDAGIVHVVTAGNLGTVEAEYRNHGIETPEGTFRSVLANEFTTIVGATDSQGTTTFRDDRAAIFSSVDAGAEFSMHGVNVGVPPYEDDSKEFSSGTSYAAPQVSALVNDMLEANPKLTVADVEDLLTRSTVPINGSKRQIGAGQIDPERALKLAEQTAFISRNA